MVLVDWVFSFWSRGEVLRTVDAKLGSEYVGVEVEVVLKLGLLCSHFELVAGPNMRQVVEYLEGDIPLPELKLMGISAAGLTFAHQEEFDNFTLSYSSFIGNAFSHSSSIARHKLVFKVYLEPFYSHRPTVTWDPLWIQHENSEPFNNSKKLAGRNKSVQSDSGPAHHVRPKPPVLSPHCGPTQG
ncbi:hypothetical protein RHMOL_Rhmol04G0264200 [Rhododendron molle]|uniref:Uncharacterized protein n=1 Tax=Rhododendron molle TaxID=49168 RepID=A0ACC0P6Z8_RHOML|nr:hypothetical protein RHMOL_Rhmol04G0264200 [Rhododendron molle]